ncbi:myeloid cell surface antigen CD33-like isoform 1-T1 [Sarcophilus harrisii]
MRTRFLLLVILFWRSVLSQKPPKIEVYSPVTVREGMCVTIPCKIRFSPFFWSLTASWFREGADTARDKPVATNRNQDVQEDTQGRFTFRQHPMIQDCSLSITDARKADSGKYFLEVTIGESQKYTYTDLKVYVDVTEGFCLLSVCI